MTLISTLNLLSVMIPSALLVTLSTLIEPYSLAAGISAMVMVRDAMGSLPSSFHEKVRVWSPGVAGTYLKGMRTAVVHLALEGDVVDGVFFVSGSAMA